MIWTRGFVTVGLGPWARYGARVPGARTGALPFFSTRLGEARPFFGTRLGPQKCPPEARPRTVPKTCAKKWPRQVAPGNGPKNWPPREASGSGPREWSQEVDPGSGPRELPQGVAPGSGAKEWRERPAPLIVAKGWCETCLSRMAALSGARLASIFGHVPQGSHIVVFWSESGWVIGAPWQASSVAPRT